MLLDAAFAGCVSAAKAMGSPVLEQSAQAVEGDLQIFSEMTFAHAAFITRAR